MTSAALLLAILEFAAPFQVTRGGHAVEVSGHPFLDAAAIEFHSGSRLLKRDLFSILRYEGAEGLAFRRLEVRGLPNGLVFAVAHQVGADGVNTESALYRVRKNEVVSLWRQHRFLRFSQEALCFGSLGAYGRGIAELRMDDASSCVMCDHTYIVSISNWRRGQFVKREIGRTKKKHATGKAAAREFGIECQDPIVGLLSRGAG